MRLAIQVSHKVSNNGNSYWLAKTGNDRARRFERNYSRSGADDAKHAATTIAVEKNWLNPDMRLVSGQLPDGGYAFVLVAV